MAYKDVVLNDSPVFYHRIEETEPVAFGDTIADETANNNDGSAYTGGTENYDYDKAGLITDGGTGVEFLGEDREGIEQPNFQSIQDITVEIWVQLTSLPSAETCLFDFGAAWGTGLTVDSGGTLRVYDGASGQTLLSNSTLSSGTTYHIVVTNDHTNGELKIYIDANEDASFSGTLSDDAVGGDTGYFHTGRGSSASPVADGPPAIYDEVAGWDSILTATQIQEHYDAGTGSGGGGGGRSSLTVLGA